MTMVGIQVNLSEQFESESVNVTQQALYLP